MSHFSFHHQFDEAGARLHWSPHHVRDESGAPIQLNTPLDVKGLLGSDRRKYALELTQLFPKDALWIQESQDPGIKC
jgi:protein TIF31